MALLGLPSSGLSSRRWDPLNARQSGICSRSSLSALVQAGSYRHHHGCVKPFCHRTCSYTYVSPGIAAGIIVLIIAGTMTLLAPWFMFALYRGKFWSTQALLIGLAGVPDLDWLEQQLFGFSENRLKWSPYSSTLSTHVPKSQRSRLERSVRQLRQSRKPRPMALKATGLLTQMKQPRKPILSIKTGFSQSWTLTP